MKKLKVLLADDHLNLMNTVEGLLGPAFEVVGKVCDGESLLKAAVELEPDVIVTDISMPILNGIDAAIKLKESGCTSKIVFLTVQNDSDFVRVCLSTGAFGYVVKTQMATDLAPAIREALAGRIFVSPYPQRKALFIDPDPEIYAMLLNILDPLGWSIRHAPDNKTALTLAEASHFDLIVTSEKTSGKEDIELLRKIRKIRHTRLIILTEESTPAEVIASMRERAFSYFSRPFSLASLSDMVRSAAEGPCWDDGIEVLSAKPDWLRILARCDLKTADRLVQFLHEIIDLPEAESDAVSAAFREILMNAIEHGGHLRPDQYVEISYIRARHMVMCRVKDPGEGFSLDELEHAAIANPREDPVRHVTLRDSKGLRPGGFGVLLAQKLVDELIYNEKGNEVLLIKYLDVAPLERSDSH